MLIFAIEPECPQDASNMSGSWHRGTRRVRRTRTGVINQPVCYLFVDRATAPKLPNGSTGTDCPSTQKPVVESRTDLPQNWIDRSGGLSDRGSSNLQHLECSLPSTGTQSSNRKLGSLSDLPAYCDLHQQCQR